MSGASVFGRDLGLIHEVVVTGRKVGADRRFWVKLAHDKSLFGKVVNLVEKTRYIYRVTVDYTRNLEEMIRAGYYAWSSRGITEERFPVEVKEGTEDITVVLFHFSHGESTEEIVELLKQDEYSPATLPELLALGEARPEIQQDFPIVALGTISPERDVACLDYRDNSGLYERCLFLLPYENVWSKPYVRFAAVREAD